MSRGRKPNVRIVYKSGATIDLHATKFQVRMQDAQIVELTWADATPRPLAIGVDEIAAVWELRR